MIVVVSVMNFIFSNNSPEKIQLPLMIYSNVSRLIEFFSFNALKKYTDEEHLSQSNPKKINFKFFLFLFHVQ
jgi:hypothetical protein